METNGARFAWALSALLLLCTLGCRGDRPEAPSTKGGVLPASAAAADWVCVLLEPEAIAALPEQVATWSVVREDPARWSSLPRFPLFTSEVVIGFEPDLVLVSPWTDAAVVRRVREAGVAVVDVVEPSAWLPLIDTGRQIAAATESLERFEVFAAALEERRSALAAASAGRPPVRVLPYSNGGSGGFAMGTGTTLDLALSLAGCTNAAAELGVEGPTSFTDEQLLSAQFDWLLVGGEDGVSSSAEIVRGKESLARLNAIAEDRIIVIDDALFASGSHTILDAAEEIAAAVAAR